jgi:HEAT repeat protein
VPTRLLFVCLLAAFAFGQTPPTADRCRDMLDRGLSARNPDTRKQAVLALSIGGAREPFLSMLEAMLNDKDVEVRLSTVASLEDLKDKGTLAALQRALNDDVPEVSFAAAKALWGLKDPSGKVALLSILSGEAKTSSGFLTKQKRDALRMMHTPKPMFMFAVKTGIGYAPVPGLGQGVASMQGLLADSGVSGRATAALLLGMEKDSETMQALREALSDKEWSVRAAAVHSLALRNDPALEGEIVPVLEDSNEPVRLRAAAAYLRLETIKAIRRPVRKKK